MSSKPSSQQDSQPDSDREPSRTLSADVVFHLLQNSRRRRVVEYLTEHDGPVELGSIATWIAAHESDQPPGDVSPDARQRVYISLYQTHMPKLDDNDVVDYDEETKQVFRGANAATLEGPLEYERQARTDPEQSNAERGDEGSVRDQYGWIPYYVGISIGGLVSIAASSLLGLPASILSLRILNVMLLGLYSFVFVGNVFWPRGIL